MDDDEIKNLLTLYNDVSSNKSENNPSSRALSEFGSGLNEKKISDYIRQSIASDLSPNRVLRAIFESLAESQNSLISETVLCSIRAILRWQFQTLESARAFTLELTKIVPFLTQVSTLRKSFQLMDKTFQKICSLKEEKPSKQYISEAVLSIIPPLFNILNEETTEFENKDGAFPSNVHCQRWLDNIIMSKFPDYALPSIIDTLMELPLTETQISDFIESIFSSLKETKLSIVAEKILPPLRKYPKLSFSCLNKFILTALELEKENNAESSQSLCNLIKTLFTISTSSRTVLDGFVKILTSQIGLPSHFTPFLIALTFNLSRLAPKVKDTFLKFFNEQLKIDSIRIRSNFLTSNYYLRKEFSSMISIEKAFSKAIQLSSYHIESNAHYFVEFAFILIDEANFGSYFKKDNGKIKECNSDFKPIPLRQIQIGIKILKKSLKLFHSSSNEIYNQIVQRLISNSTNSIYLIQILNSPEHLLEVIDYMQYLDLDVIEQLMKFAVPKIIQNEGLFDRAIINSRKFLNEYYKSINKLLEMTMVLPNSTNEVLSELIKEITSTFDDYVIRFTIKNQMNDKKVMKGISRQEKFDANYAPKLHYIIDKVRSTTKNLIHKKLLDEELLETYCSLKGTEIKIPMNNRKKKGKEIEEDEMMDEERDEEQIYY
ncbi:hypothetical protein GPJ56_009019 [Histomonas meleagridis]|uniref:uncharacterized protein n=1 Tax=Histomonas meleagridis TaxID=135588 RepID=UPI00355981C1|nr:hypothetical protein GPJ56_009019 [Histomonas meleagridis]KAH0799326.1 hypothetical protein GO595_008123 [Histomonas meleagridis]